MPSRNPGFQPNSEVIIEYLSSLAVNEKKTEQKDCLENPGIDPGTSHMLSERSTI